jgi:hypothetical protein
MFFLITDLLLEKMLSFLPTPEEELENVKKDEEKAYLVSIKLSDKLIEN